MGVAGKDRGTEWGEKEQTEAGVGLAVKATTGTYTPLWAVEPDMALSCSLPAK